LVPNTVLFCRAIPVSYGWFPSAAAFYDAVTVPRPTRLSGPLTKYFNYVDSERVKPDLALRANDVTEGRQVRLVGAQTKGEVPTARPSGAKSEPSGRIRTAMDLIWSSTINWPSPAASSAPSQGE